MKRNLIRRLKIPISLMKSNEFDEIGQLQIEAVKNQYRRRFHMHNKTFTMSKSVI